MSNATIQPLKYVTGGGSSADALASKRIMTRPGYIYSTIFTKAGEVTAGGATLAAATAAGIVYWKAAAVEAEVTDTAAITTMHSDDTSGIAAGVMASSAGNAVPCGWLRCNGDVLDKAAFPELYAALKDTAWELDDSGDTFKLPDTRGMFERDMDDGASVDPDTREVGSTQEAGAPEISGKFNTRPATPDITGEGGSFSGGGNTREANGLTIGTSFANIGIHTINFSASKSSSVYKAGLTEVRPTNFATKKIIKY